MKKEISQCCFFLIISFKRIPLETFSEMTYLGIKEEMKGQSFAEMHRA